MAQKDAVKQAVNPVKFRLQPDAKRNTNNLKCPIFVKMCNDLFALVDLGHASPVPTKVCLLQTYDVRTVWPWVDGVIPRNEKLAHVIDHGRWTDFDALTGIGNIKAISSAACTSPLSAEPECLCTCHKILGIYISP